MGGRARLRYSGIWSGARLKARFRGSISPFWGVNLGPWLSPTWKGKSPANNFGVRPPPRHSQTYTFHPFTPAFCICTRALNIGKMLYLVGLGLADEKDITVKGLEIVKKAERVYLEAYTAVLLVEKEVLVSPSDPLPMIKSRNMIAN